MSAILEMESNQEIDNSSNKQTIRQVKIGKDSFNVISIFAGQKTSSELVYNAAVKKILYENKD